MTPPRRRQSPYAGSLRQRRGALLRELTSAGSVEIDRDTEAAATLVADGLARVAGAALVLPEHS